MWVYCRFHVADSDFMRQILHIQTNLHFRTLMYTLNPNVSHQSDTCRKAPRA